MSQAIRTLGILLLAATVMATTIIPMSVEELARHAEEVVEGQALESWSEWNAEHTLIHTYTRFQVARSLKGASPAVLIVKQLGGTAGGYAQKVSGVRRFQVGEESLLFLRRSAAGDGTRVVVGLMQGNFRIVRAADGQRLASNGISAMQSDHGSVGSALRPLAEIEARVQRTVSR